MDNTLAQNFIKTFIFVYLKYFCTSASLLALALCHLRRNCSLEGKALFGLKIGIKQGHIIRMLFNG